MHSAAWLCLLVGACCLATVRGARAARTPYAHSVSMAPYRQDIAHHYGAKEGLPAGPAARIEIAKGRLVACWETDVFRFDGTKWRRAAKKGGPLREALPEGVVPPAGVTARAAVRDGHGVTWVATDRGLYRVAGAKLEPVPASAEDGPPGDNLQCLALDGSGHLWVGTDRGAALYRGGLWHRLTGRQGLPVLDVRCIAPGHDGSVWFGTAHGAARLLDGKWRYYAGRRWLPDDCVSAIAVDRSGDAWIATASGIAHIEYRPMTFGEKAEHYEAIIAARHNRRGYVADGGLRVPGDLSSFVYDATDNDGLWTSLYVLAEAFRYGATHDPQARALAKKSMDAMLFLLDVTGIPGFMARAVAHRDENCTGYDLNDPNWQHVNPKYPGLIWKDDTSSDEVDGHYLAWYVYHDLVADAAEKRRIERACRAVTDHILDHGYYLIGPSGHHTTWGVWAPERLNDDPKWRNERGLNSLQMLSFLKVAIHLCGDKRYVEAYHDLIDKHHYALNTLDQKILPPEGENNHSDDELAWCAYYPLLILEKDPALRALYRMSLERTQRILQPEGAPFYNFLYGALTGQPCDAEAGVEWLRVAPWDLVTWTMVNSHRVDVRIDPDAGRFDEKQSTHVLPMSERAVNRWNSNPYELDGGSGGSGEVEGTFWLLPYWMGRYHGILTEPPPAEPGARKAEGRR